MGTPGDKTGSIKEVVVKTEPELTPPAPSPQQPSPLTFPVQHTLSPSEQITIPHIGAKPEAFRQIELEQSKIGKIM